MKVGFTGTREGMTELQLANVTLRFFEATEVHHGDCVGADKQAHEIAKLLGARTVSHPPIKNDHRAFCEADEQRLPLDYRERNFRIVDETEILVAAPSQTSEEGEVTRSGTWMTIRMALKRGRKVFVCWADGICTEKWRGREEI